jgi:hypothetical protein
MLLFQLPPPAPSLKRRGKNFMERYPNIPDVRDGLTEVERTILFVLHEARKEYGDRMIPAALIYGRVVERLDMSWEEFQRALVRVS